MSSAAPLLTLTAFLGRAKRAFLAGPAGTEEQRSALLYIGNAAGDLDTIVSALTAAFVRGAPAPDALHVPVMPFARADFRLRQDAALLFAHCGFEVDGEGAPCDLLFWDEISAELASAWRGESLGLVLTDHNSLTPAVSAALGEDVRSIIDHHQDERRHLETCDGAARQIDTAAGSACSLVANEALMGAAAGGGGGGGGGGVNEALGTLLLAAVTADCRGFDPKQRRFDWADVTAAHTLLHGVQDVRT